MWTCASGERPEGDREVAGEHTGGGESYARRDGRQLHVRRPVAVECAARVAQEHVARGRRGRGGHRTFCATTPAPAQLDAAILVVVVN